MSKKNIFLKLFISLLLPFYAMATNEVDLSQRAREAGINMYWDPLSQNCILEKDGHQVSFQSGGNFILRDFGFIIQEKAPIIKDGKLISTVSFFNETEQFFKSGNKIEKTASLSGTVVPEKSPSEFGGTSAILEPDASFSIGTIGTILIDPGHGGKDPGASATHVINGKKITVVEKDINLNVSLKLYNMLKKAYPKKNIVMTRSTDKYLTLGQRVDIANSVDSSSKEAVLYVSVHVNASLDKAANGFEVWYLSPGYRRQVIDTDAVEDKNLALILNNMMEEEYTTESILMARFIADGLNTQIGGQSPQRGTKAEEWFVVKNAKMPSVLVETGFLTNDKEAALLSDNDYLQKISVGIYNGLQSFISHFELSRGFTGR